MSDLFVPEEELNADLCFTSGQVFRFVRSEQGWEGVDGSNVIRTKKVRGGWKVSSFPNEMAYHRFFRLDVSFFDVGKEIQRRAPELSSFINIQRGMRVLQPERVDETLFSFLCTPNNNLNRIVKMVEKLSEYGKVNKTGFYEFPKIKQIAGVQESELRVQGFGYRGRVIPQVAKMIMEKPSGWLENLKNASYENAFRELQTLPGVGPKVSDCVCLIGMGHTSAVPVDTHIWKMATELYFPEWKNKAVTWQRYEAVGKLFREKFGELAGFAQQYLFYDSLSKYRNRGGLFVK